MSDRCLICGAVPVDAHHWPRTRRYGNATVPLCREHHTAAHWARQDIVEQLIDRAPGYWLREGTYDQNIEELETWLAKRRYREVMWIN